MTPRRILAALGQRFISTPISRDCWPPLCCGLAPSAFPPFCNHCSLLSLSVWPRARSGDIIGVMVALSGQWSIVNSILLVILVLYIQVRNLFVWTPHLCKFVFVISTKNVHQNKLFSLRSQLIQCQNFVGTNNYLRK